MNNSFQVNSAMCSLHSFLPQITNAECACVYVYVWDKENLV